MRVEHEDVIMLKHILFLYSFLTCEVLVIGLLRGRWSLQKTEKCINPEQYEYDIYFIKKKYNRTHYGFDGEVEFTEEVTEYNYGVGLEACRKMDGGCKVVYKFSDDSMCRTAEKHLKINFGRLLVSLGLEPHCPIPAGVYRIEDFKIDQRNLPHQAQTGEYIIEARITRNLENGSVKFACVRMFATFTRDYDEDDD